MKKLNMNDLNFDFTNYKEHADGLRLWFISSLDFHPTSLKKVSVTANVGYQSLLDFVSCEIKCMNYKNMNNLRHYIEGLTETENLPNVENIENNECYNS